MVCVDNPAVVWRPFPEEPYIANIRINLIFLETRIMGLHFATDNMDLSSILHSNFSSGLRKNFSPRVTFRPFKVIQGFGTNQKRICDFLLVRHSNLGSILHCFRDIARLLLMTPPLFHPKFGVFPLDQIAHIRVSPSINLKLISGEMIFELYYSNLCDHGTWTSQMDRQTDGQTTHSDTTALFIDRAVINDKIVIMMNTIGLRKWNSDNVSHSFCKATLLEAYCQSVSQTA